MKIGVNQVVQNSRVISYTIFDTETMKFSEDINKLSDYFSNLPKVDAFTLEIEYSTGIIVLGKNKEKFVVSIGTRQVFDISKHNIMRYNLINAKFDSAKRLHLLDGRLPDLCTMFNGDNVSFHGFLASNSSGSGGQSIKFIGSKHNKLGVVKCPLYVRSKDIYYECLYKEVATVLGVKCCSAEIVKYAGKDCVISYYSYSIVEDILVSFKQFMASTGTSNIQQLLGYFDSDFKSELDKLLILDYLLIQEDRHMSNLSILNNKFLYPTYDNGRCLGNGSITHFSQSFRLYVERLSRDYIKSLIPLDGNMLDKIVNILEKYKVSSSVRVEVRNNVRRLYGR